MEWPGPRMQEREKKSSVLYIVKSKPKKLLYTSMGTRTVKVHFIVLELGEGMRRRNHAGCSG